MIERLQQRRQEDGFTLVELLVVIVILGILAAIVVFAVGGITDKGEKASNDTDIAVLQSAQEAYFAKNGVYTTEGTLQTDKFLRTLSTKNGICLKADDPATTTVNEANTDYKVVPGTPVSGVGTTTSHCGALWIAG